MLRFTLFICLGMVAANTLGQPALSKDFTTTTSQPYDVVDAQSKQYFTDNRGFAYSVKTNEENVMVQKFDLQNMKEVARNEYKDTPPYNKAIDVIHIGDHFFYLYESFNKSTEKRSVFVRELMTEDCTLGKERLLFSSEGDIANGPVSESIGFWGVKGGPPFNVFTSFDNSKIMINYRRKPISKSDAINHDILGFFVLDASMQLIWGREVTMPYTEKEMNNLAYMVGADGTAYMMSLYKDERDFRLLTIPPSGDINITVVANGKFMFKNLYMKENKDGHIDFLGFYANGLEFKYEGSWGNLSFNINGIRYFEISKQGKILSSKDIEFPIDLINKYESSFQQDKNERREEVGKAGIRDLVLRQFEVYPDGSVFILGEQYYYIQTYNANTYQMTYKFFYEDLVATKLDANGNVLWMKKLPKRQIGSNGRGGMGIAYLQGNQSHYILFLDNVKNADIDIDEVPAKHVDGLGGYLTAYKIDDATGNYTKHNIYNSAEINGIKTFQFQTGRIFQASDRVMVAEVYIKNKKDMLIKMELVK